MRSDLRWKVFVIFLIAAVFAVLISPQAQFFFKEDPIRLGLDLKGGMELLLAPDFRLGTKPLAKYGDEMISEFQKKNITLPKVEPLGSMEGDRYDGVKFIFPSAADAQKAYNSGSISDQYPLDFFGEKKNLIITQKVKGNALEVSILQDERDFPEDALERSKAIIENRINEKSSGMAEADVRLDGKGRINVQLPGISDLKKANEIITATGRLNFRINNRIVLDGTELKNIGVHLDQTKGGYVIDFEFKGAGAKQLATITAENKGKQMAVYLDESELMNPTIESEIPDGRGIITFGKSSKEEVEKYALLMKSGALPISLKVLQSTQVAPTLGKEIVKQSGVAAIISLIMIMGFMIAFYRMPGSIANGALIIYGIMLLGVMAIFRGVLTLPGMAGFILSLGMAVDANIIIFERIKDEIRNGKRVRPAVKSGFDRAYITILDSNLTTLISALVLFFFGTSSIQGFAVTLGIGVIVSMFTAIFVSKVFLEWRIDNDPDRFAKSFGAKEVVAE